MVAQTARALDVRRNTTESRGAQKLKGSGDGSERQSLPSTQELREAMESVREELVVARHDQAMLRQAIFEAAQVQRRLCAPRELVWGEFEIAGEIFPVRHLSGDFFKVMHLDSVLGLVVGDIAGKGLSAGIWQAHLMGMIQRCARKHANPADAVAEVNRELCEEDGEWPLAALFFARLDPQSNDLVYCNAGLPAPLIMTHNNSVERLDKGGPMLGALQGAAFNSGKARLNPGDMLIAYTDGVTECRNSQEEEFEIGRLSAAASAVSGASANQALFSTLATVLDFADACSLSDDLTLLVVRRYAANVKEKPNSRTGDFQEPRGGPTSLASKRVNQRGHGSKQLN